MPTALAPNLRAAVTSTRPSPQPRSKSVSPGLRSAAANILSTIGCGEGTNGAKLRACGMLDGCAAQIMLPRISGDSAAGYFAVGYQILDIAVLLLSMCFFFAIGMPIAYALALSSLVGALWIDLGVLLGGIVGVPVLGHVGARHSPYAGVV